MARAMALALSLALLAGTAMAVDWVIGGSDPDEAVTLVVDRFVDGDVIVANRGRLAVGSGVTLSVAGEVILLGDARLEVAGGRLRFPQAFAYQSGFLLLERAAMALTDSEVQGGGRSFGAGLAGTAAADWTRVRVTDGFCTWAPQDQSRVTLDGCTNAGEFVPFGEVTVEITRSSVVLIWMTLFDGSRIDVELPPPGAVTEFRLDATTPWASGIPYSVQVTDCTGVMWAVMARNGSEARVRHSELRVVGTLLEGDHEVAVSGVANGADLGTASFAWGDVRYEFVDSRVETWNFYCWGTTRLTLSACVFGELIVDGGGEAWIDGSLCDGSGGYLGAFGQGTLVLVNSVNLSQTTAGGSGLVFAAHSALLNPTVDAVDESVIALANSLTEADPRARDAAVVFDARLEPLTAAAGATVPVRGTARMLPGPDSAQAFESYRLDYAVSAEPPGWVPLSGPVPEMKREEVLAHWPTAGLAPGRYMLRLTVQPASGEPFAVLGAADVVPAAPPPGDLDDDGRLSSRDLEILRLHLAGLLQSGQPPFSAPPERADLDGDGLATAADLILGAAVLAGM